MKYITGIYALNFAAPEGTPGDWHYSCIDWNNVPFADSANSPFGDWGIYKREVPEKGMCNVANHLRACIDLINQGQIITPADVNVWPHEMKTAKALAKAGYVVEFIVRREGTRQTSADVKMNDLIWEIKSPKAGKTQAIERNLKRARRQSSNILL